MPLEEETMHPCRWSPVSFQAGLASVLLLAALSSPSVQAQGTGGPTSRDSNVGYLDSAIPGNQFRLRFDAGDHDPSPARAEFFYAQAQPRGPGLPVPDPAVNFQELTEYLEVAADERLSGFVELPQRFLEPEINADHSGLGDMNAGVKYAFLYGPDLVATFQFRTYVPTGAASRGLGTHHVSLEPSFLFHKPLSDRFGLDGELRYWAPVGGTDFAGDVIRYGLGVHYDLWRTQNTQIVPVVEVIGWTVLGGKETVVQPTGVATVQDAAGDSILNVKVGVHVKSDSWWDLYTGYGRALTGNRWYDNIYRVELRLLF
jgi:hypothetical protein